MLERALFSSFLYIFMRPTSVLRSALIIAPKGPDSPVNYPQTVAITRRQSPPGHYAGDAGGLGVCRNSCRGWFSGDGGPRARYWQMVCVGSPWARRRCGFAPPVHAEERLTSSPQTGKAGPSPSAVLRVRMTN